MQVIHNCKIRKSDYTCEVEDDEEFAPGLKVETEDFWRFFFCSSTAFFAFQLTAKFAEILHCDVAQNWI